MTESIDAQPLAWLVIPTKVQTMPYATTLQPSRALLDLAECIPLRIVEAHRVRYEHAMAALRARLNPHPTPE